jgi:glycosyltransferase involved in cell wall biosynthesis
MKVLTFGWDFPPQTTGGLGIACQGLTRELAHTGVEVIFVLPRSQEVQGTGKFIFADVEKMVKTREVTSSLVPYMGSQTLVDVYDAFGRRKIYSRTILEEVHAFAHRAAEIAKEEDFDIIHAHDWTSYLAGVAAKKATGKPLVLHVHATAFDQAASDNIDPEVYKIEKEAFAYADCIVTVSDFTKRIIVEKHNAEPQKIEVVHNGCDTNEPTLHPKALQELRAHGKKIVLYHGRITIQKGVDYFIDAARRVIDTDPSVIFVISGKGDMMAQIMHKVGALGLSSHVIFAGALWYEERDQMYQSVDLVVMPSVSEPFGLVPLEAMQHGTPALISKQSGVSEVLSHVLKVDFWDTDEMANMILSALRYPVMRRQLVQEGKQELKRLSWKHAAAKVMTLYRRLVQYVTP